MSSDVRNSLKFGKMFRKDLLCTKMYKNGYREFDFSGTLNAVTIQVFLAEKLAHRLDWKILIANSA